MSSPPPAKGRRWRPAATSKRRSSGWRSRTSPPCPSTDDLRQIIVRPGTPALRAAGAAAAGPSSNALRIGDVADVVEGFPPPIGDAVINAATA